MALARALAAEPEVLLLDEPLAGLDVAAAASMRKVLRRVLASGGRCAVLVTHDLLDVLTLADRVIVVDGGRIVESGPAAEVLATPKSHFGARFAGVNLIGGTVTADGALATILGCALARRTRRRGVTRCIRGRGVLAGLGLGVPR